MACLLCWLKQVTELQQEFGGANFATASRLFVREGDLCKVWYDITVPCPAAPHRTAPGFALPLYGVGILASPSSTEPHTTAAAMLYHASSAPIYGVAIRQLVPFVPDYHTSILYEATFMFGVTVPYLCAGGTWRKK